MRSGRRRKSNVYRSLVGLAGVVYILENEGLRQGWYKIGCSTRSGQARANDLNLDAGTGTPGLFQCVYQCRSVDCGTAEQEVFAALGSYRRGKWGQEFFHIDIDLAKSTIEKICADVDRRHLDAAPRVQERKATSEAPRQSEGLAQTVYAPSNAVPTSSTHQSKRIWIVAAALIAAFLWFRSGPNVQAPTPNQPVASTSKNSNWKPQASMDSPQRDAGKRVDPSMPQVGGQSVARDSPKSSVTKRTTTSDDRATSPPQPAKDAHGVDVSRQPRQVLPPGAKSQDALNEDIPRNIDLSSLNPMEKRSIDSACLHERLNGGPAAYNRCLTKQLAALEAAPRNIDLSSLNPMEKRSIDSACLHERLNGGPAAYNRCLTKQLAALEAAPRNIDLSSLNPMEKRSIDSACLHERLNGGPAAYNRCLTKQLAALEAAPRNIDLSSLNPMEKRSIDSACLHERLNGGPAAYNRCLTKQLAALEAAPRNIDLSSLNPMEKRSIDSACLHERLNGGPAAYNRCLTKQLKQLGSVRQSLSK
jgi:plasmid maintenance system killer protein